ncbi:type IV secretory pathway protein VirD4 [Rhodomicrobium udaipurense JA643]|uniref:TraM recognition domain-containing protein n=1 Tax=Rhodomicrobium udaipurense TaxID=1202716 RepID=A0A8I1GGN2_9HYPH|nr:type IV secretory system conjugative DNA transfer family protein [Rhodomicrobium udaipurense]KAI93773.1 type IV secretory pathway protein VirD4 [Rhodomicrobium udaipurense JA643]MBJ7544418.1 TraM recognition domain-containing protein [Rhodomicrobium udaipurense]
MSALVTSYAHIRPGIELGFFRCQPVIYEGTEPVAIDAQAGKGKLTRFLGVNLVSPRTAHLTKIVTDPKDAELAWVSWKTLERQGYRVRFVNPGRLYGYPSESFNFNTRLLETASQLAFRPLVWEAAYDAASYLVPVDPNPAHKWIGQGVRTSFALYNKITALYPSPRWPCNVGGLWDFFGRAPDEIADDLLLWASDSRMEEDWGMCRLIASLTASTDQWNAYSSTVVERLQGFQPGSAARSITEENSFDPADMKRERTAIFIIGSARSETSRNFVGSMAAAIIERFADAHGPLRALVVGEEWGQLYVSNFHEILTLYRQGGINFLGVFQNAAAQVENRYGRELARIWRKAVAHTIYRGLPDTETLKEIEHRSGKTSVMVRGLNVNQNQVSGSGDNLAEQARPLLQVEDIRAATGGETGLLDSRDQGFFTLEMPSFWERPELSGYLRDARKKPDRYDWLARAPYPIIPDYTR